MDLGIMVNTEEVLLETAKQNEEFNLFDFFDKGKNYSHIEAACGFITRKQYFYTFCESYHELVFENVCASIFDDKNPTRNIYYEIFNKHYRQNVLDHVKCDTWRFTNEDLGVVSIQLLSKSSVFVWIPNKINTFQKEKILEFFNNIKEINNYMIENNYPIVKIWFYIKQREKEYLSFNMDEIKKYIDSIIDDNYIELFENDLNNYKPKTKIKKIC